MSRRRPARRRSSEPGNRRGSESIEHADDGDWVTRRVTGSAAGKHYRCPGCQQTIAPATPHTVAWPVEGSTWQGGGVDDRRHWHTACWRARERRR